MENPWDKLPSVEPFIPPEDESYIFEFNQYASTDHKVLTNILPEPFLGNPSHAKVILLNLNPGFSDKDLVWHKREDFVSENKKNLLHESNPPFYLLNPAFNESGGFIWWNAHLKQLIDHHGLPVVSNKIMCIEYFPYHSKRYKPMPIIPSQLYTFSLVKDGMKRKLPIIIMRGKSLWTKAIPELSTYPYRTLNSPQNVSITKNNLPTGVFEKIDQLLSL